MSELVTRHYIDLTDEEAEDFTTIIDDVFESYERLDQLEDPSPEVTETTAIPDTSRERLARPRRTST